MRLVCDVAGWRNGRVRLAVFGVCVILATMVMDDVNLTTGAASGFTSIAGVENVTGGTANDVITGDTLANRLVGLGGNDMLRKSSQQDIENNLREMLKTIKARGMDAVLIGVPAPGLITSAPEFYDKLAKEFGIPYEGRIVTSVLYKPELKSDPVHPNADGYRRIAEAMAGLLRDAGAI